MCVVKSSKIYRDWVVISSSFLGEMFGMMLWVATWLLSFIGLVSVTVTSVLETLVSS